MGILVVAAVIFVAFVTVTLLRRPRPPDPMYEGKRLSAWLDIYGQGYAKGTIHVEALRAIRQIGTNGLPLLLDWLNYEPPLSRYPIFQRLSNRILRSRPVWNLLANPKAAQRATIATDAFFLLSEAALPAIPELTRRASLKSTSVRRQNSMIALLNTLTTVDRPPPPALAVVLSEPGTSVFLDLDLQKRVRELGTNARPLVPLLVRNFRANSTVASTSAAILGELRLEPDVVVPAMAKCLRDPDAHLRAEAAWVLGRFSRAASTALPALTNALSDPDLRVRVNAAGAIEAIAPKVSTAGAAQ